MYDRSHVHILVRPSIHIHTYSSEHLTATSYTYIHMLILEYFNRSNQMIVNRLRRSHNFTYASPLQLTGVQADRTCVCNIMYVVIQNNQMSPPNSAARHHSVIHRGHRPGTMVRSLWFLCTFPKPCLIQMQLGYR